MLIASLRYACLAAVLVCNALFFWGFEARTDALLALAFGSAPAETRGKVIRTEMTETRAFSLSNPSSLRQPEPAESGR